MPSSKASQKRARKPSTKSQLALEFQPRAMKSNSKEKRGRIPHCSSQLLPATAFFLAFQQPQSFVELLQEVPNAYYLLPKPQEKVPTAKRGGDRNRHLRCDAESTDMMPKQLTFSRTHRLSIMLFILLFQIS